MNRDSSIGRALNLEDAFAFFTKVKEAEAVMGPLSREERLVILKNFGTDVTLEDLVEQTKGKRVLVVGGKSEGNNDKTATS